MTSPETSPAPQTAAPLIRMEQDGPLAVLTLDDPGSLNAIGRIMALQIQQALAALQAGSDARCLLLTGTGRAFCAGANLVEGVGEAGMGPDRDLGIALEERYHPILKALRDLPMPVIAAVNGPAVGIGMSLALMGDVIVAAESAYFLLGFQKIGLVPDGGATWLLPRIIGRARAMELALFGEKLSAAKAESWGLVNRVVPDTELDNAVRETASRLASGPTRAIALTRRAFWTSPDNPYEAQLDLERELQKQAGRTRDFEEGVAAFLEKRPPNFKGA